MLTLNIAVVLSFLAFSAVAPRAHAFPSHRLSRHNVPAQFQERGYTDNEDLLEPYAQYHERYELFDCKGNHNHTSFWNSCCHPLLKTQTVEDLPEECYKDVPCDSPPPTTTTTSGAPLTTTTHLTTTTSTHHTTTSTIGGGGGGGGGGNGNWYTGGHATFYYQYGNAGACGKYHQDGDIIVAISNAHYGPESKPSRCFQQVEIVNLQNGQYVKAIVADLCPTCKPAASMDLSLGTFKALNPGVPWDKLKAEGEFNIKWRFVSE